MACANAVREKSGRTHDTHDTRRGLYERVVKIGQRGGEALGSPLVAGLGRKVGGLVGIPHARLVPHQRCQIGRHRLRTTRKTRQDSRVAA